MSNGNGDTPPSNDAALAEAEMIRAIAEGLANRFGLDLADGKLMDRPILCLLFMVENLLNRVELIEEVMQIAQKETKRVVTPD